MPECFIIMQIGNPELDKVCEQAILPAIKACGLEPKRVDKHNTGGLLKSEIIDFIGRAEIIVADLTNERPNCYLEIGYAMGIDKFRNLILTVREDHNPESPNHSKGSPKVHFDLAGYDILFWDRNHLDKFKEELIKRIQRRQAILIPTIEGEVIRLWDETWIESQRKIAFEGFNATGKTGFMEIRFALDHPKPNISQHELLDAAHNAVIHTFGWPIGVCMTRNDYQPKPRADGIVAEISTEDRAAGYWTYDYWSIRKNGDFYLLKSLFEDERDSSKIFFNTRIVRVTETLLYCARLYTRLGIDPSAFANIAIKHGGLKGRVLSSTGSRLLFDDKRCSEDEVETQVRSTLSGLETDLVDLVKQLTAPLFVLFDFAGFDDSIYQDIVNSFVKGRVT
jgi:hypothetical protein